MNDRRFRWGIREKLTLLFFTVTLVAMSVNFLIVVPRLELRMRNDRVKDMSQMADRLGPGLVELFETRDPQLQSPVESVWSRPLTVLSASAGERVALLRRESLASPIGPMTRFSVIYDPTGETRTDTGATIVDRVAERAVSTKRTAAGTDSFGTGLHAVAATPLIDSFGRSVGAIVYSTSLSSVTATVRQIARRQLFSSVIALSIALVAALLASSYMARRLRRLEVAARKVAGGDFTEPLVIDSEDEIGEVARAFNTMQDRLGRADRARKAFIANASHELRTPLFSLGGYVELMREEDLDAETQREFLDQMHAQIKRMTKLATDLLDLSKIDTESLAIQPRQVDLTGLTRSIGREFEPQAQLHESTISITGGDDGDAVEAICDPDRVAQIMRILIDNALSHTPTGTAVRIDLASDSAGVTIEVADNGPGIPEAEVGRVFDRFHTGDKAGGTGLGLAIARDLAVAMKGSLNLTTGPQGTAFTLRLPAGVRVRKQA
jgi:signal transduction histidine kinase